MTFSNDTILTLDDLQGRIRVFHLYVAPCLCVIGFVGNVIGSIVLMDQDLRTPISIFLTGLAISNSMTLVTYVPFVLILLRFDEASAMKSQYTNPLLCAISHVVINTTAISNWLTVSVAMYMLAVLRGICNPFKIMSSARAKQFNYSLYVGISILCAPNYYEIQGTGNIIFKNATVWNLGVGSGIQRDTPINSLNVFIQSVLMRIVPCLLMVIVVAVLVRSIRIAAKISRDIINVDMDEDTRHKMNVAQSVVIRRILVIMLVLITVVESTNGVMLFLAHRDRDLFLVYLAAGDLFTTLVLLVNGTSFLLYCFMSENFRNACWNASCHHRSVSISSVGDHRR